MRDVEGRQDEMMGSARMVGAGSYKETRGGKLRVGQIP